LGIRDEPGLLAAIYHPQNVFFYGNCDIFDIGAAYAFHIAQAINGLRLALRWSFSNRTV
jgi:prophage maintenance system killer protein